MDWRQSFASMHSAGRGDPDFMGVFGPDPNILKRFAIGMNKHASS